MRLRTTLVALLVATLLFVSAGIASAGSASTAGTRDPGLCLFLKKLNLGLCY